MTLSRGRFIGFATAIIIMAFSAGVLARGWLAEPTAMASVTDREAAQDASLAQSQVDAAQKEYDAAMRDLHSDLGASPAGSPDPEWLQSQRQIVEQLELMCRKHRISCEEAELTRRHYEESAGHL